MKKTFYLNTLQPADRLVIPKSNLGMIQHHVIYLGMDKNGARKYIENAIGKGVQIVDEAYLFRDGYELTRIERFIGNPSQRSAAIQFAMQLLGKKYDLFNFNCEHYANTVQHRKSYSTQVSTGFVLSFVAIAASVLGVGLSKNTNR